MHRLDWSVQPRSIGAALLGAGLGLLLALALPGTASWWPLGLVLGGALLWLRPGARTVSLALVGAALALAGAAAPLWGRAAQPVVTVASTPAQHALWQDARHVVVVTRVGNIRAVGPLPEGEAVQVRASYRGRAAPPTEVQASYDPASRTLVVSGARPGDPDGDRATDLELRLPSGVSLSARVGTGAITLVLEQPASAPLEAEAEVGDVSLTLPAASDAAVQAVSGLRQFGGRLERVTATERRLTLGTGQHPLSLRAEVGRVEVRTR